MSFFSRLKNIIKSNIYSGSDTIDLTEPTGSFENYKEEYREENSTDTMPENNPDAEYYAILEVKYGADFDEIKKSYRKLLKKYHPDLYHNNPEKFKTAEKLMEKINSAYSYFEEKYK